MKWVTRQDVRVGRMACGWLIRRFVDPGAEILYVPGDQVMQVAEQQGATPFHVPDVAFTHRDRRTPFEAILERYELNRDPALDLLGRIVNGADTDNSLYEQPEGPGVRAVADGIREMRLGSDEETVRQASVIFDALYLYCLTRTRGEAR